MSDDFNALIDRANAFFTELGVNNNREWFTEHKQRYEDDIRKPAELLSTLLAEDLSRDLDQKLTPKVFRIHRDIRFSKDKTPYKEHLHMLWRPAGNGPVWFLGAAPDYLIVGCGKMQMDKPVLDRFRAAIDRDGADLQAALDQIFATPGARIGDVGAAPLKRVPKPYAPDHPRAELLRRKALTVSIPLGPERQAQGLIAEVRDRMQILRPLGDWMSTHLA